LSRLKKARKQHEKVCDSGVTGFDDRTSVS
jgi:hypothetical protein